MTNYPISNSTYKLLTKSGFPGLVKGCTQVFVTDVLRETFGIEIGYFKIETGYLVYAFEKKFFENRLSTRYLELSNNEGDENDPLNVVKGKTLQKAVEKLIVGVIHLIDENSNSNSSR